MEKQVQEPCSNQSLFTLESGMPISMLISVESGPLCATKQRVFVPRYDALKHLLHPCL